MKIQRGTVVGSLVGAVVIQLVFACSSGSMAKLSSLLDASSSAHADGSSGTSDTTSTCSQWEMQSFAASSIGAQWVPAFADAGAAASELPSVNGVKGTYVLTLGATTLPAGWEPISEGDFGSGVLARHCLAD